MKEEKKDEKKKELTAEELENANGGNQVIGIW